jgi:transposase
MSKRKTNRYDFEFKKSSAALACQSEKSVADTAKELGVHLTTLHGWIRKYGPNAQSEKIKPSELTLTEEVKQLRKENTRLKLERDILKKAAAYFANDSL